MVYSSALVLCVGKDDAEVARRAAAIGREVDELRKHGVAGTPAEVVDASAATPRPVPSASTCRSSTSPTSTTSTWSRPRWRPSSAEDAGPGAVCVAVAASRNGARGGQPGQEGVDRHRTGEDVALDDVAAEVGQHGGGLDVLHAFGDEVEAEVVGERHGVLDDDGGPAVADDVPR